MHEKQSVVIEKFKSQALTFFVMMWFGRWITFVSVAVVIVSALKDSIIVMYTVARNFGLSGHRVDF